MNGLGALTVEAILDAIRRKLALAVAASCVLSVMVLDSCTAAMATNMEVNGEAVDLSSLVAGSAGAATLVVLTLWLVALAGVLAADQLRQTLEDGSATLALARPVSRFSFGLARLGGVLVIAWGAAVVLMGAASFLLASRHGVDLAPAGAATAACLLGALAMAAWAMTASLYLPRVATVLLVFAVVGAMALSNAIGAATELGGVYGALNDWGPPFASTAIVSLVSWLPEAAQEGLRVDGTTAWLRLVAWTAAGLVTLFVSIRRIEIGR